MSASSEARKEGRLKRRLYLLRSCGSCNACCTIMRVDALDKPEDTPCTHLRKDHPEGGCGIYESRPSACKEWACVWRSGTDVLREDERPDQLGVMLETWAPEAYPEARAILVKKVPDVELNGKTFFMLNRLAEKHLLIFIGNPNHVRGPKEKVDAFARAPREARP